jgi:hypothetical protein
MGQAGSAQLRFHHLLLLPLLTLAASAPRATPASVGAFRQIVALENFQVATNAASVLAAPVANGRGTELLWSLTAGAAGLHAYDGPRSVSMLDDAEDLMRASEEATFNWGSTYRFGTYDAVMVNAHKAFAMLGRGDRDGVRVELNRMEERQTRYTAVLGAAAFEAIAKAVLISGANAVGTGISRNNNSTGTLAAGILLDLAATAAANVTRSDTRSWSLRPREFQVARLPVPGRGALSLQAMGGRSERVTVPTGCCSIVLVKAQSAGSPLTIQVFPL